MMQNRRADTHVRTWKKFGLTLRSAPENKHKRIAETPVSVSANYILFEHPGFDYRLLLDA